MFRLRVRPKWIETTELVLARAMLSLPPRLQVLLSGRPQVVIDGEPLHPNMQLMLSLTGEAGQLRTRSHDDISIARQRMLEATTLFPRSVPPVATVRELLF